MFAGTNLIISANGKVGEGGNNGLLACPVNSETANGPVQGNAMTLVAIHI